MAITSRIMREIREKRDVNKNNFLRLGDANNNIFYHFFLNLMTGAVAVLVVWTTLTLTNLLCNLLFTFPTYTISDMLFGQTPVKNELKVDYSNPEIYKNNKTMFPSISGYLFVKDDILVNRYNPNTFVGKITYTTKDYLNGLKYIDIFNGHVTFLPDDVAGLDMNIGTMK